MAYDGSIVFDTKVDTDGFTDGISNIGKNSNTLTSTFSKLQIAIATAFSITAITSFTAKTVELASSLEEVQNVVDVAFDSMSYKMEEFCETSLQVFGLAETTAKQMASSYTAMGSAMGLALGNATDMSLALTGLAGDMASFYNVTHDEAQTALTSIYTGETETLKRVSKYVIYLDGNREQSEKTQQTKHKLLDWEQDESYIFSAINKVAPNI